MAAIHADKNDINHHRNNEIVRHVRSEMTRDQLQSIKDVQWQGNIQSCTADASRNDDMARLYPSTDDADFIEDTRKRKKICLFIILSPSSLRPANFDLRDSLDTHRAVLTPILMLHRK